jgi:hypothetical protein
MRASTSAGPAAGNGTTIVIGRAGKDCATALRHADGTTAAPAAEGRTRRRKCRRGRFTCVPPTPSDLILKEAALLKDEADG